MAVDSVLLGIELHPIFRWCIFELKGLRRFIG
jgi:hypothetical protein